jgi:hypothetical protein
MAQTKENPMTIKMPLRPALALLVLPMLLLSARGAHADGEPPFAVEVSPAHVRVVRTQAVQLVIDVRRLDPGFVDPIRVWLGVADGTPLPARLGISATEATVCGQCTRTLIGVRAESWARPGIAEYYVFAASGEHTVATPVLLDVR